MDDEGSLQCHDLIIRRLRVQIQVDLSGKQWLNLSCLLALTTAKEGRRKQQDVDVLHKQVTQKGENVYHDAPSTNKVQYILYMCSL